MIGVRTTCASDLDTLKQGAIDHGVNGTRNSVSTYLICKFKLLNQVACLPPEIVIMSFHYHYLAAKRGTESPEKKDTLREVAQLVREYNVTFLMMDANMALFNVIDAVRNDGQHVDVLSWMPWNTNPQGPLGVRRAMDSCCIAIINEPGRYRLQDRDWSKASTLPYMVATADNGQKVLTNGAGCGQLTTAYVIPPSSNFDRELAKVLAPSVNLGDGADETWGACAQTLPAEMLKHIRNNGRLPEQRNIRGADNIAKYRTYLLRTKEVRSDRKFLELDGPKATDGLLNGMHYPLHFMTTMPTNRSNEGWDNARSRRRKDGKKGHGRATAWAASAITDGGRDSASAEGGAGSAITDGDAAPNRAAREEEDAVRPWERWQLNQSRQCTAGLLRQVRDPNLNMGTEWEDSGGAAHDWGRQTREGRGRGLREGRGSGAGRRIPPGWQRR